MEGKNIVGIALVIIMGIVIFGIVSIINATLDNIDQKCNTCGDDCKIAACSNNSSSTGKMFTYVLIGIYIVSAAGILYFSFKKSDEAPKIANDYTAEGAASSQGEQGPVQGGEDEFAYG
ncbi:MAG: hypothetical protein ABIG84_03880 [archaeon]